MKLKEWVEVSVDEFNETVHDMPLDPVAEPGEMRFLDGLCVPVAKITYLPSTKFFLWKEREGKELSNSSKANYVRGGGRYCPHCGSKSLFKRLRGFGPTYRESFTPDIEDHGEVRVAVACNECDEKWFDMMTLHGIEERDHEK